MKISNIHIKNFMSFKDASLKFTPSGLYLVSGWNKDAETANGSGKSAIFDAILWGMFGSTTKNVRAEDVVNYKIGKNCSVHIELQSDGATYRITRYRNHDEHKNDVKFFCNTVEIKGKDAKETQKFINEQLGFDYDSFTSSIIFPQERKYYFVSATDSERKELLCRLLDLNFLDNARALAITQKAQNFTAISVGESALVIKSQSLGKLQQQQKELEVEQIEEQAQKAIKIKEIDDKIMVLREIDVDILQAEKEINRQKIKGNKEILSSVAEVDKSISIIREEVRIRSSKIKELEVGHNKIKKLEGGKCPVCQQGVGLSHIEQCAAEISGQTEQLTRELNTESAEIHKLEIKKLQLKQQLTDEDEIYNHIDRLDNLIKKANEVEMLQKMRDEIENRLQPYQKHSESLKKQITDTQTDLAEVEIKLAESKQNALYLEFLTEAFGDRGIKSFLLDTVIFELNNKINKFLNVLFNGKMSARFLPETVTTTGKVNNKTSLEVILGATVTTFEALSGGEKRRLSLAVDLALSEVVLERKNKKFNMLVLDESMENLDEEGKNQTIILLKQLVSKYENIFCVSHDLAFQAKFDNIIHVEKENGASRIV